MLSAIAKLLLRLGGWTAVGGIPADPKAVIIAAPHTSNWDGFWGLVYKISIGLEVHFFAKHSLFWFPLGNLLSALGGIKLDRERAASAVQQAIDCFEAQDRFYFGLAPEGTRKKTSGWKSGFYRIALGAGVPVYLGMLDFGQRRVGLGARLELTGDEETDLEACRRFYADVRGRWPDKASPIVFADRRRTPSPERHRTIRSFVRRSGRLTPSQERALQELWPEYGVDFAPETCELDALFQRSAPVVLEIGFGNGETLVEQASASPDLDFIGIEVHEPGVGHCLLKARDAGVRNLRLIMHDAVEVLARQIPPLSLQRVNIYFPDPWPKKRHHKRRLLQPAFLELVHSRLEPGGSLHIATDWANYAEHIDELLEASALFTLDERREHGGDAPLDRPQTKFERRGLRKGHRICDWRFTKPSGSD